MKLNVRTITYLLFIILVIGCAKNEKGTVADAETVLKVAEIQKVAGGKNVTAKEEESADEIKKPEPIPTDEGFSYGEWKFLNVINSYLPGDSSNVKTKVLTSKVWILKGNEVFNSKVPPDSVENFDSKGNRIKDISYTRDVSGNIYEYDENNRLFAIVPIIAGEVNESKRITLKYFKKEDGSILRKSYIDNELILEELETKKNDGWEYSWKKPTSNNYQRTIIIQKNNQVDTLVDYYASGGSTRFTFEYKNKLIKSVSTIDAGDKIPYRIYDFFYDENGLLKKENLFDPRKKPTVILRQSTFSDYDKHGNWQKESSTFDYGGKEIVIRRFTYADE